MNAAVNALIGCLIHHNHLVGVSGSVRGVLVVVVVELVVIMAVVFGSMSVISHITSARGCCCLAYFFH